MAGDWWLEAGDWWLGIGGRGLVAARGLGPGWLLAGDSDWSLAIQLVDWLAVQGDTFQCQGIGPRGAWILVQRLVMVVGCW